MAELVEFCSQDDRLCAADEPGAQHVLDPELLDGGAVLRGDALRDQVGLGP